MSSSRPPSSVSETAGLLGGLVKQGRLVWRLWRDGRVSGWAKLIPLVALVYLVSPIDLIPDLMLPGLGELDDLAVVLLFLKMFVELAPPGIVREHLQKMAGRQAKGRAGNGEEPAGEPYVDAPYRIVDREEN